MKISDAFRDAFRVYKEHFGGTMKFLVVEACMTLAAFAPPENGRKAIPGSIAFVPSVAGLFIAGEIIREMIGAQAGEQ